MTKSWPVPEGLPDRRGPRYFIAARQFLSPNTSRSRLGWLFRAAKFNGLEQYTDGHNHSQLGAGDCFSLMSKQRRTRLYEIRKRAGLTLRQLSQLTDVPAARLSEYERGRSQPRVKAAIRIARLLRRSVEELFE